MSSLLLTVNQEFSKTEDVIFGAPSAIYRVSMDIHIYRETLYISARKPLLSSFNHFSFTGVLSHGNLRRFSLLFTLSVMTAANLECNDVEWISVRF